MQKPNILYLNSHDTGRHVQPYGHAVPTPHIQRLAEDGVLFRRAFCASPTCAPSRAALLTGQCAHSSGMLGLAHRGFSLNDYSRHLLHTLRAHGYYSALAGFQHLTAPDEKERMGYDVILPHESTRVEHVAPAAVEFLKGVPSQPFFLDVGFFETHRPFPKPDAQDDARYCLPPAPLPDTAETRRDMAAFKTSARILDNGIGAVLAALEASGLAQSTLVICTTDHGLAFPAMKCNLTDHGIGVSLILRGPDEFGGGKVIDALVSQIDLFPTLCDWLEIEPPAWLEGQSLMPLLRGEVEEVHDAIFAEVNYHASYEPQRAVRTKHWKYIRRFGKRRQTVLPNADDAPSKDVWLQHGWGEREAATEQLYDLVFDPHESHNLAGSESHSAVLAEMRGRLDSWMRETADPLLQGFVPAPQHARINDGGGISNSEPAMQEFDPATL